MLIFLHGQDSYRSRQKLNDIVERYRKIHRNGLNLIRLKGEDLKFEDFKDVIRQVSMFGERKLLVLSNVFSNQDFKERFSESFKDFSETGDTILFYDEDKVSEQDKFSKLLKSKAKAQEFPLLTGEKLRAWVKKEFLELGAEVNPEVLAKLIDYAGNDLWFLSNEVKKLVSYKKGGKVSVDDVVLLTEPKVETAIFKTIDAISQKNKKQALQLIHRHLKKGDSPLYLLAMINFQFRNLLVVKDLMEKQRPYYFILKTSGLHPFVVKKSYQQAGKFTFSELKKIYQKIFQADFEIKMGKIAPETALDLLIAGI